MRLLSFLESVEAALRADGHDITPAQVSRQVDYGAGLARMELTDGLSLMVQNFHLADGQFCLKAWWQVGAQAPSEVRSFFDATGTDWKSAARQLAAIKPEATAAGGEDLGSNDEPLVGERSAYRSAV